MRLPRWRSLGSAVFLITTMMLIFKSLPNKECSIIEDTPDADERIKGVSPPQLNAKMKEDASTNQSPLLNINERMKEDGISTHQSKQPPLSVNTISRTKENISHQSASSSSKVIKCIKPHCREYLSKEDQSREKACLLEASRKARNNPLSKIVENNCSFMDGKHRSPVALASIEGSGNTWVRGLLERASGICTGFIICDYMMRTKGFIGENIKSGSVLVVKTHSFQPPWARVKKVRTEADYDSAIFILRNPYDSLIAEWNRRLTNEVLIKKKLPHQESHTNLIPKELWSRYINHTGMGGSTQDITIEIMWLPSNA